MHHQIREGSCNAEKEQYGVAAMPMIEDPEGVTVERLVLDIIANPGQEHKAPSMLTTNPWIAPSPTGTRLRLFCLPYAGGVSENVFARQALPNLHYLHDLNLALD